MAVVYTIIYLTIVITNNLRILTALRSVFKIVY